jgi:Flp pilus assembly protein TadD
LATPFYDPALPYFGLPPLAAALLVLVLSAGVFLNTLPNDFVLDDDVLIVRNWVLHRADGLWYIFTTHALAFTGDKAGDYYRPLMFTFWFPLWRVFHGSPLGYHALNILLHAGVSLLLFVWLRRMQPNARVAWLAALLFAVHPIHTESVAWVSAIPDLQCALFFILGFWLYLRAKDAPGWHRWAMFAATAACTFLSLLAKEIGFALPLLLLLYELHKRRTEGGAAVNVRDALVAASTSALAIAAYLVLRAHALAGGTYLISSWLWAAVARAAAAWPALLYEYLWRIVFPVRLRAFQTLPFAVPAWRTLAGLVAAALLCTAAIRLYRRRRLEWLGIALLLATLLPSFLASLRGGDHLALGERYLYLPSIGFCWLLAAALEHVTRFRRGLLVASVTLLAALYSARAIYRNADWRREVPFYLHELQTEGESAELRSFLYGALMREGKPDQALEHAQAWARLSPTDRRPHRALCEAYWSAENSDAALPECRTAAELARQRSDISKAVDEFNNLGVLCTQAGRLEQAIEAFREVTRLSRDSAEGHYSLGLALLNAGRAQEAGTELRKVLRVAPGYAWAHANLGSALAASDDWAGARAALKAAVQLEPNNAEMLARAGEVEKQAGDPQAARQFFYRALALDPSNARARGGLAEPSSDHKAR